MQWPAVSPLTSSSLEGQLSSAYSAEMCFYSGVMSHVHTSSYAVKNETFSYLAHCLELQLMAMIESCIYSESQSNSVK